MERDSGCEYPFYRPKGHSCIVLSAGVVPNVPNASRIIGPAGKTTAPALLIRRERKIVQAIIFTRNIRSTPSVRAAVAAKY